MELSARDRLNGKRPTEIVMSWIELPHWLMIAGALLVLAGVVGLALSRNKEDEADPVVLPGDAPWRDLRSDPATPSTPPSTSMSDRQASISILVLFAFGLCLGWLVAT